MNKCATIGCKGRGKYPRNGSKLCFKCMGKLKSKITNITVCPIIPQEIVITPNPVDIEVHIEPGPVLVKPGFDDTKPKTIEAVAYCTNSGDGLCHTELLSCDECPTPKPKRRGRKPKQELSNGTA